MQPCSHNPHDQDDLVERYLDPALPEVEYIVVDINAQGTVAVQKMLIDNPGWGTRHPMASENVRCGEERYAAFKQWTLA